jgi:hypothetical protein
MYVPTYAGLSSQNTQGQVSYILSTEYIFKTILSADASMSSL